MTSIVNNLIRIRYGFANHVAGVALPTMLRAIILYSQPQNGLKIDSLKPRIAWTTIPEGVRAKPRRSSVAVSGNSTSSSRQDEEEATEGNTKKKKKFVDTRIHWDNPDEGWIGGPDSDEENSDEQRKGLKLGDLFGDMLAEASNSHYQFLGVAPAAELDEIKAAYRRLSKEYHPDSTSLPLETASKKFMRLREAYDVLSTEEKRQFYDWSLAQEVSSRRGNVQLGMEMDHPQQVGWKSKPDMVDRLGGRNMKLSSQAMAAISIDAVIILFAIGCIIYSLYFKDT